MLNTRTTSRRLSDSMTVLSWKHDNSPGVKNTCRRQENVRKRAHAKAEVSEELMEMQETRELQAREEYEQDLRMNAWDDMIERDWSGDFDNDYDDDGYSDQGDWRTVYKTQYFYDVEDDLI